MINTHKAASLVFKTGFLFDDKIKGVVTRAISILTSTPPASGSKEKPDTIGAFPQELFEKHLKVI
jgi:hypothetical protein